MGVKNRSQSSTYHDSETVNGDSALAVVLDDLVIGTLGTSALDECVSVALEGESILAHVDPPDILNRAGTLAVNTLNLVYDTQSAHASNDTRT